MGKGRWGVAWIVSAVGMGVLAASSSSLAQEPRRPTAEERLEWIVEQLDAQRVEHHVPGMALAIVAGDRVVLLHGFGQADMETGRPVTGDTRFAVGSTTKAFTGALVGMLADEGVMDLDDPIHKHLPDFRLHDPLADAGLSARDLLSHRSGLAAMDPLWYGIDVSRTDILAAATQAELLNPFREKFVYCNVGFLAVGVASANAAGTAWDELLAERLLRPLGMRTANSTYGAAQTDPEMAKGYRWDKDKQAHVHQPMRNLNSIGPAGSINASARDMSRWVIFQLGRGEIDGQRLLSEERHAEAWHKHIDMGPNMGYGLGWMLREWEGRQVVEHGGGIDGFAAQVAMIPASNVGYVLLMNLFGSPVQESSRDIVFRGLLGDISEPENAETDLDRFAGVYIANFGPFTDARFTVRHRGGKLWLDVPGQMDFELRPPNADGWRPFVVSNQIAARFDETDGGVQGLTILQAGLRFEVPREGVVRPLEMTPEEAAPFLGNYHLQAMDITIRALYRNGRLALDVPGQMVFELRPPDEDGWRAMRAIDAIRVRFNLDDEGRVVSMTQMQGGQETLMERIGGPDDGDVLPTTAEVLDLVRSAGAMDTEGRVRTLRAEGSLRMVHVGIEGRETITATSDGRMRAVVDFGRFGRTETVIGRERGWSDSTAMPDMELGADLLWQGRIQNPMTLIGDWTSIFDRVAVQSRTELDGRPAYAVRLEHDGRPPVTITVDAETGLPGTMDAQHYNAFGTPYPITYRFDDWRDIGGVRFPHRIGMDIPMMGRMVGQFDRVEANVAVEDALFEPPQGREE